MPPMEIISDLATQGFQIEECHNMVSRKTGEPMPLFMLSMEISKKQKPSSKPSPASVMSRSQWKSSTRNINCPSASDARDFSTRENSAWARPGV
ncbi:hypothetical protein TNCT_84131 [Trichonephila clavata]|uniref:Pre-C2HC domain-containing protein n=1 Tax=Trichonephila clavata TaxID=2740835 RepID=A0A8X6HFR9_TRICU|nr:hypothetical protein TNCT_84131 [Trichonephila clavata]